MTTCDIVEGLGDVLRVQQRVQEAKRGQFFGKASIIEERHNSSKRGRRSGCTTDQDWLPPDENSIPVTLRCYIRETLCI